MTTYADFQEQSASEKVGLVALEAAKRLMGWELYSGSVYRVAFEFDVVTQILENGTELTAATSVAGITAGKYYFDRTNSYIYLRTSDSSNPNSKFLASTIRLHFANCPVRAPWDLASGYSVPWRPILKSTSQFGADLDNTNLLGFAIEGQGNVAFYNDQTFWPELYDKLFFEGQQCYVYSWSRTLPITEASLIYRGKVDSKNYTNQTIQFNLKDQLSALRSTISLASLSEVVGAKIPGSLNDAKQRLLVGYVKGHRPTNIDQILELTGYTLDGTVAVTKSSQTVTGTGTDFLTQLSPNDEVIFGSDTDSYTVQSVDSATQITLTEVYEGGSSTSLAVRLKESDRGKRYANRIHLVAGHELREPSTTVTKIFSTTIFEVADPTDFLSGEPVVLNGENLVVERVSGARITLTQSAASISVGDTIKVISVRNVYLNNKLLTNIRDYTYDAETARITLDDLAEFNVASTRSLTGTLAFTSSSRTVTGTSTLFTKELKSGDWIRRANESDWFEVLTIASDTSLTLRSASTYTASGASYNKSPDIFDNDSVLSCDVLGVTEDGTKEGVFVNNAARAVKYLLNEVGLEDIIDEDSFDEMDEVSSPFIGFAVPAEVSSTSVPVVRDLINNINQSVFGSLYQTQDFMLAYSTLSPRRPASMKVFKESDLLDWSVSSSSQNLTKTVNVEYAAKEYDPSVKDNSKSIASASSDDVTYFTNIQTVKTIKTYLVDDEDASRFAKRWAFILGISNSTMKAKLGLKAALVNINEPIHFEHPKLYDRIGSGLSHRIGGCSSIKKDASRSYLEVDDVGASFSRCATITEEDASDWSSAAEEERFVNGYITDEYGMIENDAETFGINLIW